MAALPPGGETAVELQLSRDSRSGDLGGRPTERVKTAEKQREGYTIIAFSGPDDPTCPFNWPLRKKLWVVFIINLQILWATMLSTIYASATAGIAEEFHVSDLVARIPQATYLLGFSVGPVILTPLAEDYGRKYIYTGCILVLYVLQIPCALAHSIATLIVVRFIAGCFASPLLNSVASIPDMFCEDDPLQGYVLQFWAHCAELIILGTLMGGYIVAAQGWRWIFWWSAIIGGALAVPYVLFVPETRGGPILAQRARRLRKKTGDPKVRALAELYRRSWRQIVQESVVRPAKMLVTEPAVLLFGFWDGLSYGLVFVLLEAFPLIYSLHGFTDTSSGLTFISVYLGFLIGLAFYPLQRRYEGRARKKHGPEPFPEASLIWGFAAAFILPISLWWMAWTIQPSIPWIVSLIAAVGLGISGHIIFMVASIYVVESYGDFASSAVSGQSFLREAMSALLAVVSARFYENVGYSQATSILAAISTLMLPLPFVFYHYEDAQIRARSHFLQELRKIKLAEAEADPDSPNHPNHK